MIVRNLDSEITLYQNNELLGAIDILEKINTKQTKENVWQIANKNNINNTDITIDSDVLYLISGDSFLNEKRKLSELLNEYALPFILDYLESLDVSVRSIKPWTICKNMQNYEFHSDKTKSAAPHKYCVLVFLNDEYEGGGLQFKDRVGNDLITFKAGDVLIYPSNEEYLHKALPITDGIQYVAITYF